MKKKVDIEKVLSVGKNRRLLFEFIAYCIQHPELRFWQALNTWSGLPNLVVMDVEGKVARDTFYFEHKDH